MVRNYIRKTTRGNWDESQMKLAIGAVRKKELSIRKAAVVFSVPKDALHRRVTGKLKSIAEDQLHRKFLSPARNVLSEKQEKQLADYIKQMDSSFYGLSINEIRRLVFEFAEQNKLDHPFNKEKKMAGRDFVAGFLRRQKTLSLRKPEAIALNRVFGITCVHKPVKVIAPKGKRVVASVASGERGQTTTIICAMSATGTFVPPLMIFKRKRMNPELIERAPPGTIGGVSDSGWVDTDLFFKFVKHFVKHTKCSKDSKVLLILDGHKSHTKNIQLIDYAKENGLFLLSLPPHTSHKLQPLDRSFFKGLKSGFNVACNSWLRKHPARRITVDKLGELFKYLQDPREAASTEDQAATMEPTSVPSDQQIEATQNEHQPTTMEPTPGPSNESLDSFVITSAESTYDPELEFSFEKILPVPKIVAKQGKKRSEESQIITSSPYKKSLQEAEKKSKQKQVKGGKRKPTASKKGAKKQEKGKQKKKASSDYKCLVCDGGWLESLPGEDWIQCTKCSVWYHENCCSLNSMTDFKKRKKPALKCKEIVRKFVCLADKEQADAPDCEEHRQLLMAGLGEMKLSLPEEAEESDIRATLAAKFPKLEFAGGFELMYSESRSRELKVIPPGPEGITMKYMTSFIGQGKVYIRPIQENLPLVSLQKESNLESNAQREMCNNCMELIQLHKLRQHYLNCKAKVPSFSNKGSSDESLRNDCVVSFPPSGFASAGHSATRFASVSSTPKLSSVSKANAGSLSKSSKKEYREFISLIDDDDCDWSDNYAEKEDPDFLAAIEASLSEDAKNKKVTNETIEELVSKFIEETIIFPSDDNENQYVNIIVHRRFIYQSTVRAIERKCFSFFKPFTVTFSGESAVDTGGPKQEFLRLLMLSVKESGIIQGSWFSHDLSLLGSSKYKLAGKLVAWSILHGGPGLKSLCRQGFQIFQGVPYDKEEALNAVSDPSFKEVLTAIHTCDSEVNFEEKVVNLHADFIAQNGYSKVYTAKFVMKLDMLEALLQQYYVYSVHSEIRQFIDGMNCIGKFGDKVLANQRVLEQLMCEANAKLTSQKFKSLYNVSYSECGSNLRIEEENSIYSFELFIQDLEEGQVDGLALEDLLIFVTGAEDVPPLGFSKPITVEFYSNTARERRLPWSSTCALELHLPRGCQPEAFKEVMSQALLDCQGFGIV
eukprot:gene18367-20214_t